MIKEIPEYLEAELQTAKDEYKVKTTTYVTLTRFEYEKLIQENQQLKDELETSKQYEDYYKDLSNKSLNTVGKYISVIHEIREHIKEHNDCLEKAKEIYIGYENELLKSTCIQLINNELVRSDDLLQILDKVKGDDNNV